MISHHPYSGTNGDIFCIVKYDFGTRPLLRVHLQDRKTIHLQQGVGKKSGKSAESKLYPRCEHETLFTEHSGMSLTGHASIIPVQLCRNQLIKEIAALSTKPDGGIMIKSMYSEFSRERGKYHFATSLFQNVRRAMAET